MIRPSSIRCWQCGQPLQLNQQGKLIAVVLEDPIGNFVRVHKVCAKDTKGQFKPVTAQPSDQEVAKLNLRGSNDRFSE